jgi:hypothetical protein
MRRWLYSLFFVFIVLCLNVGVASMQDEVTLSGQLTVLYGDPPQDSSLQPQVHVLLEDAQGNVIARVMMSYGQAMEYYLDQVEVTGRLAAPGDLIIQTAQPGVSQVIIASSIKRTSESIASQLVSGPQPWVNLLCKFSDIATEPKTPAQYQALFGTAYPGLDHYWQQISEGLINLAGTVTLNQWVTLPQPRSYYVVNNNPNLGQIMFDCTAAADALVNFTPFIGINVMLNEGIGCCAWGGSRVLTLDGQTKSYRTTWLPPWSQTHDVIAHEMGHGFGLPHSSGPADSPPSNLSIYVSQWDVMSDSNGTCAVSVTNYGCLGQGTIAYYLDTLGWLPVAQRIIVPTNTVQTFTLERLRLDLPSNGLLYARIPIGASTTQFYTVEVRELSGYDQNVPALAVVIHYVDLNTPSSNNTGPALVVDADDGNDNVNDAGARWLPGETFYDGVRGVEVAVLSQNGSTFSIRVRNNYFPSGTNTPTNTPTVTPTPIPVDNDLIQNAVVINNLPYTRNQSIAGATVTAGDPSPCSIGPSATVWYRYTSPVAQTVTVNTQGSNYDTVLGVYTGSPGSLAQVTCNDDAVPGSEVYSNVSFSASAGTAYYIMASSYDAVPYGNTLVVNVSGSAPANTPTRTPTRTSTPTVTQTPTVTRTPTATSTNVSEQNLIQNGTFDQLNGSNVPLYWTMYASPNLSLLQWQVQNGVLRFYRNPLPGQRSEAVVYQNTNAAFNANSGIRAEFELGNSSNVRKRVTVLVHEGNFTDLHVCTFWLPPNTPLRSYGIRTHTNVAWTNASLSVYASTADGVGHILLDNVGLFREASFVNRTLCDDPGSPAPGVGADGANFIDNPSFTTSIPLSGGSANNAWLPYGNPTSALVWRQLGGVFEFYRNGNSTTSAVVMQADSLQMPANVPVEITFQVGNSSNQRMRVMVILHQSSFQDLHACTFWLNPNTPTTSSYVIRTYATQNWTGGTTLSIYSASTGNGSGYTRVDNVSVRQRPSLNIVGTECYGPGSSPVDATFQPDEAVAIEPLTLEPTASAVPGQNNGQPELPVEATLPSADAGAGEGGMYEKPASP